MILSVGPDLGPPSVPGALQGLVDAFPPARLAHLGLGPVPEATGDPAWTGPPGELLVDDASPHLVEIARTVASIISNPGHEVTVTPAPRVEATRRKTRTKATLALEVMRPLGPSALHTLLALATAEDPAHACDIARAAPRVSPASSARLLCSELRVAVIGDVVVQGGLRAGLTLARAQSGDGWDMGASYLRSLR